MKTTLQQKRILAGKCPLCGKEAAPYRLCYDHRQGLRLTRVLKRGTRLGMFKAEQRIDGKYYSLGAKNNDPAVRKEAHKWSTPLHLPETDRRSRPRLRGISVDIEETILAIMSRIGRPCTIEEITAAWGRLRDRRSAPLASDLATIIAAKDKRERKMAKRAAPILTEDQWKKSY